VFRTIVLPQQNPQTKYLLAAIHANKMRSTFASQHVLQQKKFDIK